MSDTMFGFAICGGLLAVCLAVGWLVQRLCEHEDAPLHDDQWNPATGGPCERCGFPYSVQYGVSVWFAETRRDGEVTYNVARRLCTHCREQVEAEIDETVREEVMV